MSFRRRSSATGPFIASVVTALVLSPSLAMAYEDTGYDPDDRRVHGSDPDIRSTTRRVFSRQEGRMLKLRVRAYEVFGFFWEMKVSLASQGGPRTDYVMRIQNNDQAGRVCSIFPRGHPRRDHKGRFHQDGHWASCRVSLGTPIPISESDGR
jgi:hypothetical protein